MKNEKNTPCSLFSNTNGKRGFALLLAALVASIVLALGASIYTLASKEVQLSATGRDSQFAFYAADSAAECALYWDARSDKHPYSFATSTDSKGSLAPATQIFCDGKQVTPTVSQDPAPTPTAATTTFSYDLLTSPSYCTDVQVAKFRDATTNSERTVIDANGYNVSCAALNGNTSATVLQRSVELSY